MGKRSPTVKLSVVTTLYQSAPFVGEFYRRAKSTLERMGLEYEFIFVNDGSPDPSLGLALDLMEHDPAIRVVDLSRNFGHHRAALSGLSYATGDLVFMTDCDLEEDPGLIETFYQEWAKRDGIVDVVYGTQAVRQGPWLRRLTGEIFYRLMNLVAGENIPRNLTMTRLMSRRFVDNLLRYEERTFYIDGLFQSTGFEQLTIPIDKHYKGVSTYTLRRRWSLALDGMLSQGSRLLIGVFLIGLLLSLSSFAYIVVLVYNRLIAAAPVDGWTSLMVSVWFLGGTIISSVGIVGLYVGKIFLETKKRPLVVVRKVYENNGRRPNADSRGR
ncbi:MAG TPA: glycosyltransferase family 2 protein [Vicinamibacteria bacterium]|nr:glycosyltransferase family 2 protein [Vicinamibacteria bacterium]